MESEKYKESLCQPLSAKDPYKTHYESNALGNHFFLIYFTWLML